MASLALSGACKNFEAVQVIRDVDLNIADGEFVVFVGPSGCGKSTLLRMIAGLEDISRGRLEIDGVDVSGVPPAKRGVAMVFQSYALYPHMNVARNIGFALETAGVPKATVAAKVGEVAKQLKIDGLLHRKPRQLSGGQRQRVAIGRALVRSPKVFLFDEPLSNLDADLRTEMRVELARLHKTLGTTMIYVTHDQVEAMTLADRIVVLNAGRIEQVGSPRELYANPANLFVAGFIGSPRMNVAEVREMPGLAVPAGTAKVGVRPEAVTLSDAAGERLAGAVVDRVEELGHEVLVHLRLASGTQWVARRPHEPGMPAEGAAVTVDWKPDAAYFFDAAGRRIAGVST